MHWSVVTRPTHLDLPARGWRSPLCSWCASKVAGGFVLREAVLLLAGLRCCCAAAALFRLWSTCVRVTQLL